MKTEDFDLFCSNVIKQYIKEIDDYILQSGFSKYIKVKKSLVLKKKFLLIIREKGMK